MWGQSQRCANWTFKNEHFSSYYLLHGHKNETKGTHITQNAQKQYSSNYRIVNFIRIGIEIVLIKLCIACQLYILYSRNDLNHPVLNKSASAVSFFVFPFENALFHGQKKKKYIHTHTVHLGSFSKKEKKLLAYASLKYVLLKKVWKYTVREDECSFSFFSLKSFDLPLHLSCFQALKIFYRPKNSIRPVRSRERFFCQLEKKNGHNS